MSKFQIKIKSQMSGGKLFNYTLLTTRNGYQWSGIPVANSGEMREIAKALLEKADEIDKVGNTNVHSSPSS